MKNTIQEDQLQIYCLGEFRVMKDGKIISGFGTNKTRALLAHLVVEAQRSHYRQSLAGMFWPDQPQEKAMHNLRQSLVLLRKSLGDDAEIENTPGLLLIERDTVQFNPNSRYWLDLVEFRNSLQTAYRHYQNPAKPGWLNIRFLLKAIQLYRGPFLHHVPLEDSDLFLEWMNLEQEGLNRTAIEALEHLVVYYERRGDYKTASQYAERIVQLAPWEENGHQLVMRLLAMNGQFRAVKAQYRACCSYLEESLGVEPSADTVTLYQQIQTAEKSRRTLPPRFQPDRSRLPLIGEFVGRQEELDQLSQMISDPAIRLITLLGMGGIGKTSLALQAAHEQSGVFRNGVYFVSLAGVESRAALLQALADAINFLFYGREEAETQLINYLAEKEMLLVVDNFEQITAEAGFLSDLLLSAPRLKVLVTSRLPLNLRMEFVISVQGLDYPHPAKGKAEPQADWLTQYDSMRLFDQAARRISGRPLTAEDVLPVARVCQLLDGMPLGIELSAAWTRTHTCEQIADRLESDISFLQHTMHDVDRRHHSLRAVFEHSWQLLNPELQHTLASLSVFQSQFTPEAAEAVCGCGIIHLHQLVQNCLIQSIDNENFYAIHKTFNQFCSEKLAADPVLQQAARMRHAEYYGWLTAKQLPALKSTEQKSALQLLAQEAINIHSAWVYLIGAGDWRAILDMVEPLYHFFNIRSRFSDGIAMFGQALEGIREDPEAALLRARIQAYLGALYLRIRDRKTAAVLLEESLAFLRTVAPSADLAFCLVSLSGLENSRKNMEQAQRYAEEALSIYTQIGDMWGQSYAEYMLGFNLNIQVIAEQARLHLEKSIALSRQCGDNRRLIAPLNLLADLFLSAGKAEEASLLYKEALTISQDLEDRFNMAILMNNIGSIYHLRREYEKEMEVYRQCLEICQDIGDLNGVVYALNNLGEACIPLGKHDQALQYLFDGLAAAQKVDDEWLVGLCRLNLGSLHTQMGKYEDARQFFIASLKIFDETQSPDMLLRLFNEAGSLWQATQKTDRAVWIWNYIVNHPDCDHQFRQDAAAKLKKNDQTVTDEDAYPPLEDMIGKVRLELESG